MTGSSRPHVIQTVPTTRADFGGPSRSVPFLCEALAGRGAPVELVTTVPSAGEEATSIVPDDPVRMHAVEEGNGPRTYHSFYRAVRAQARNGGPTLVHDHGLWTPTHVASALAAWKTGVPLVVSTRGMLEPWALQQKRWKKRMAWWAYQRWVLKHASLLHATADAEAESLRRLGFDQPIAVIPNGVHTETPESERRASSDGEGHQALFLSRLHRKKGLPMLLEAWADVRPPGWELVLAGPSEDGHRDELEKRVQELGLNEEVTFVGPVDDEEKWKYYASADLFVLPTHSENFGIVVAEALAAETPVLTTTGAPWEDVTTNDCGWWVEPEVEAITQALKEAVQCTDEQRQKMGIRGRALIERKYSWQSVAGRMEAVYRWLLGSGKRPQCIREA